MTVLYTAIGSSSGAGRDGRARSSDGGLDLVMAAPKELGGSGEGNNPEQLFAVGYAACFHSAVQHVARGQGIPTGDSTVTAAVGIGPRADGQPGFELTASLSICLPDVPVERRRALVDAAHQVCPYSNAVRGNVTVELVVEDET